jgi:hypothetical protein
MRCESRKQQPACWRFVVFSGSIPSYFVEGKLAQERTRFARQRSEVNFFDLNGRAATYVAEHQISRL